MKDNLIKIGLDFETSTGDVRNLAPLQIGLTINGCDYMSYIGGWAWDDSTNVRWSENSAKIHNIPQEVLADAPSVFEVDIFASAWLLPLVAGTQRMNRIVVGWNVGSFDRRIIHDWFPNLDKILSYRTLDLNTVCFFTADLLNDSFEKIKNQIKKDAAEELGAEDWHDALFDAKAGLINYRDLLEMADLDVEKLLRTK